jgi:hypothetical protein
LRFEISESHPIAHDPGAPPQRPHDETSAAPDPVALLTAKTLRLRAVFADPHAGHFTSCSPAADIDRTS